jgi:acyl-[acyl-carrier-protein] desaturase
MTAMTQTQLLLELEQVVEENLNRHLTVAKEWFPHEYVPWSDGRNFDGPLNGDAWSPEDATMSDVARSSLIVNLLTSRAVDPVELEWLRMDHMSSGYESAHSQDLVRSLAYVSFQELATRVSHRNTGKLTDDPVADALLAKVAADENLHMIFYRNLLKGALELDPNQTMRAITDVVTTFAMPGTDIAGFQRKAVQMAVAGVYDLRQHKDDVVAPVLRFWNVFDVEGLDAEGEQARTELAEFLEELEKQALRFEDKRDVLKARMAAR